MKNSIKRREFIKLTSLLSLSTSLGVSYPFLNSCKKKEGAEVSENLFENIRQVRMLIQESEDFLPKRAKDVVASGDYTQIFEFVRDAIQSLPNPINTRFDGSREISSTDYSLYRWSSQLCLRYAGGTCFEKAKLLAELLSEAGFQATFKEAKLDTEKVTWKDLFLREFDLPFTAELPGALRKKVKKTGLEIYQHAELNDDKLHEIQQQVMNHLPDDIQFHSIDWAKTAERMFFVELELDGEKIALNPNVANAKAGESYTVDRIRNVYDNERFRPVNVQLLIAHRSSPDHPKEFINHSFPKEKLFGNQLILTFQSDLDTEETLASTRSQHKVFTPILTVAGENLTEEEQREFTAIGNSINLKGDTLEVKDEQLFVNGEMVKQGVEHPEIRKLASEIDADLNEHSFDHVRIRFDVKDSDGNSLDLDGVDFQLIENDTPLPFSMEKRSVSAPKILLLFDTSTSVPKQFREEGAVEFGNQLVRNIQSSIPDCQFRAARTQAFEFETAGDWTNDQTEITNQLKTAVSKVDVSSNLWTILAKSIQTSGADAVAFVTDGVVTDDLSSKIMYQLEGGCPALLIGTGEKKDIENLQKMADITAGKMISTESHEEAIGFVEEFTQVRLDYPFSIQYNSPHREQGRNSVELKVKDSSVTFKTNYQVPEQKENSLLRGGWTGIYIKIRYGATAVERKLSGRPLIGNERFNPILQEHLDDTENALFGNYSFVFEGGKPTASVLLDEKLGAVLSQENYVKSIRKTKEDLLNAIDEGFLTYPVQYLPMQQKFGDMSGKNHHIFQNVFNLTLFSMRPVGPESEVVVSVDILPFSNWRAMHENPREAFNLTLNHSLQYMNLERKNFPDSALELLPLQTLIYQNKKELNEELQSLFREEDKSNWYKLRETTAAFFGHNADGLFLDFKQPASYLTLDQKTGTVFAEWEGKGGGRRSTEQYFAQVSRVITLYSMIMGKLNLASKCFPFWVALEKAKLKWLTKATIAILTMEGMSEEEINETVAETGCNAIGDLAGSIPGFATISTMNDLGDLVGRPIFSDCEFFPG